MIPPVTLSFFRPLPKRTPLSGGLLTFDPDEIQVRWSQTLPGGYQTATVTLTNPRNETYGHLVRMSGSVDGLTHVELMVGGVQCFAGEVRRMPERGGRISQIEVNGYGIYALAETVIESSDTTDTQSGQLIRDILLTYVPFVVPATGDDWQEPGTTHQLVEFDGMTPARAIDQILKEGGVSGHLFDLMIGADQIARLKRREAPGQPDYAPVIDETVETERDWTSLWGQVDVTYQNSGGTVVTTGLATDDTFLDRYERMTRTTLQGGQMTQAGAEQFRDTFLALHQDAIRRGRIVRTGGRGLEGYRGGEVPPHLVGVGQWARLPSTDGEVDLIITRCEYDSAGSLSVDLNGGIPDTADIFRNTVRVDRAVRERISLTTGAKERD